MQDGATTRLYLRQEVGKIIRMEIGVNIMSEFLLLCNFFVGLIILIVELGIISDLHSIRADLYYYSEQKGDFDD